MGARKKKSQVNITVNEQRRTCGMAAVLTEKGERKREYRRGLRQKRKRAKIVACYRSIRVGISPAVERMLEKIKTKISMLQSN